MQAAATFPLGTTRRYEPAAAAWRRRALYGYAALFLAVLYLPILLLIALSVNNSTVMTASWQGFTLEWYRVVAQSPELLKAIWNSTALAVCSATVASVLAVLLALGFREEFILKPLLLKVILVPVLVPGIVSGVVYLMFFGYANVTMGLWTTTLVVHITWVLPFSFLTLYPRVHGFDRSLEEAAMDLGARPVQVYRRVTLPLIWPGIVSTALFAFTLSFDEFIRTFLVVGHDRTVPVHLWALLADEMAPFLPAVGVVVTLISIAISLVGFAIAGRADRAHESKSSKTEN